MTHVQVPEPDYETLRWYKPDDVAKLLSCSKRKVYELIKDGHLVAHKNTDSNFYMILERDFRAFTAERFKLVQK